MQAKRPSLADPSRGLACSNRQVSDEVLVRNALQHGAYHLVLDAVLEFGLAFIRKPWELMLADEEGAPTARAQTDIERKLTNIERGWRLKASLVSVGRQNSCIWDARQIRCWKEPVPLRLRAPHHR